MAIQTQLYSDNLGFPFAAGDDGGGGGGGGGGGNSSQGWMETACGLNDFYLFNLQQQQQQYYQQQQLLQQRQQHKNQDLCLENGFPINANNNNDNKIAMHSRSIAGYIQKQNQEIEGFITLQNERLRLGLQAYRKQQLLTILKKYELKSEILLKQKDEEIKTATTRRLELEELLRRTEMERQTWQMAAKEKEIMVMNLHNTIEEVREKEVEDEGSCCHGGEDGDEEKVMNLMCKSCFCADSCVVMLPCRHLCSCKSCEAFLHSCPVCQMVKKATIHISLSDSNL